MAIKYRTIDEEGHVLGGPFYYIENGMGKKWKWLAKIFAFFGVCVGLMGIGTFTQVNGIASAVTNFFDPNTSWAIHLFGRDISWVVVIAGLIVTVCTALVIIGGIKRIANVSQVVVPFMAVLYVVFAVLLLLCNVTKIPDAIVQIVQGAFGYGDGIQAVSYTHLDVYKRQDSYKEAVEIAKQTIDSGKVMDKVNEFVAETKKFN